MQILVVTLVTAFCFTLSVHARDTRLMYNYKEALATPEARSKIGDDIKFYFGDQKTPEIAEDLGEAATNKKTNAFNKSDAAACQLSLIHI